MSRGACGSPGAVRPKVDQRISRGRDSGGPRVVYIRMTATAFKIMQRAVRSIDIPHSRFLFPYLPLHGLSAIGYRLSGDPGKLWSKSPALKLAGGGLRSVRVLPRADSRKPTAQLSELRSESMKEYGSVARST
jgi:hypothetical protein